MIQKYYTAIIIFFISFSVSATDYFVSPSGHDGNDGLTTQTAWKNIDFALESIEPDQGHTLFILPGRYSIYNGLKVPTGINITGMADSPAGVVLKASGDNVYTLLSLKPNLKSSSTKLFVNGNQVVSNITIDGNNICTKGIVSAERNNVKFRNLVVQNCIDHGIVLAAYEADHQNKFYVSKIYGAELSDCTVNECARKIPGSNDLYTSNIIIGGWHGGEMFNCTVYDREGDNESSGQALTHMGMELSKIYNNHFTINTQITNRWGGVFSVLSGYSAGVEFYGNTVNSGISCEHRVDEETMQLAGIKSLLIYSNRFISDREDGNVPQAIELYPDNIEIYGNYFENFNSCITSWLGNDTVNNVIIHHNVFRGNGSSTAIKLTMGGGSYNKPENHTVYQNFQIYNNVFDNLGNAIRNDHGQTRNFLVSNNVFMNCKEFAWKHDSEEDAINIRFDTNLFFECDLQNDNSAQFSNNIENTAPGLNLNGEKPGEYYFPNSAESAVVDAGTDLAAFTKGYAGGAPDLGAFELNGTVPGRLLAPVFALYPGIKYTGNQSLEIKNYNQNGKIYYTTDGTTPSWENGKEYSEPIELTQPTTVTAIVLDSLMLPGHPFSAEYQVFNTQAAKPVATPVEGAYDYSVVIKLENTSESGSIYYTTDNTIPSERNGFLYEYPVYAEGDIHLKAVAIHPEMANSEVLEVNYQINKNTVIVPRDTINDDSDKVYYSTHYWGNEDTRGKDNILDDLHTAYNQDAWFETAFSGTGIAYIAESGYDKAEEVAIYIDDEIQAMVNLKENNAVQKDTAFIRLDLPPGEHTFKAIKKSLGGKFVLDALLVYGEPTGANVLKLKPQYITASYNSGLHQLKIENKLSTEEEIKVIISDVMGRICRVEKLHLNPRQPALLYLSTLKKGVYHVAVFNSKKQKAAKISFVR